MNGVTSLITGLSVGAAAMYLLDPEKGRTRRALVSQKMTRLGRIKNQAWEASAKDAKNRLVGLWHDAASKFAKEDVSDEALTARVRAAMGRKCSHPGAIEVSCQNGVVTLSGDVLAHEVVDVVSCSRKVKGVSDVIDSLNVHSTPANVSALQGEGHLPNGVRRMPPGPAMAVGLLGLGLLMYGVARKDKAGKAVGAAGAALAAKGVLDAEGPRLKQLVAG
jgi:gas vesicle protein